MGVEILVAESKLGFERGGGERRGGAHQVVRISLMPIYIGHPDCAGAAVLIHDIEAGGAELFIHNHLLHGAQQDIVAAAGAVAGDKLDRTFRGPCF